MRGSRAAISSATAPVPSGDPSSTIRTSIDGSCDRIAGTMCGTLSASTYVGTITSAFSGNPSPFRGGPDTGQNQCYSDRDQRDQFPLLICRARECKVYVGGTFG